jgi:hypothetical protein
LDQAARLILSLFKSKYVTGNDGHIALNAAGQTMTLRSSLKWVLQVIFLINLIMREGNYVQTYPTTDRCRRRRIRAGVLRRPHSGPFHECL